MKKTVLPILLMTIWVSLSEFLRNEVLFNFYWTEHYGSMGLTFPAEPINGAIWGLWSLLMAIAIFILMKRFSLVQAALVAWLMGFVMMWVVVGNMGVLPFEILIYAFPLSLLEVFVAAWIARMFSS